MALFYSSAKEGHSWDSIKLCGLKTSVSQWVWNNGEIGLCKGSFSLLLSSKYMQPKIVGDFHFILHMTEYYTKS